MDQKIPYDDYQLPVVFLPSYENPPAWIPPHEVRKPPDSHALLVYYVIKNTIHTHTVQPKKNKTIIKWGQCLDGLFIDGTCCHYFIFCVHL